MCDESFYVAMITDFPEIQIEQTQKVITRLIIRLVSKRKKLVEGSNFKPSKCQHLL